MPRVEKCVKCGGEVIPRVMIVDRVQGGETDLTVRVDGNPAALLLKESARSRVHAYICSSCGYMEMYADNPSELFSASETAKAKSSSLDLG